MESTDKLSSWMGEHQKKKSGVYMEQDKDIYLLYAVGAIILITVIIFVLALLYTRPKPNTKDTTTTTIISDMKDKSNNVTVVGSPVTST